MALESGSGSSSPLSSAPSELSPPSSPLSWPSLSPSPPPDDELPMLNRRVRIAPYPSPPASQQTSNSGSPAPESMDSSAPTDKDGPPPAKRRKISKERTTEYLDLRSGAVDSENQVHVDRLLNVLHTRQKIVVIAGAGISVSAGIPDFRSSQGLFRSLKEEYNLKGSGKDLFDASVYKNDVSTSSFHDMVSTMSRLTKVAKPTVFHHMLATIAQEDRLLRLYSQNVDGIDTALEPLRTCVPLQKEVDGKWPRTVQLHGGLDKMVCSKCRELSDLDPELFTGPVPPLCPRCEEINDIRTNHEGKRSHGIGRLRPRMVLYNEHNPDDEAIGAVTKDDLRKRPDAVIVVGTTLKVPGVRRIVREMCATVRDRRGGVTIWLNNDPPPVSKDLEDCWDIIVQGTSDDVARLAAMRKWNEPEECNELCEISDENAKQATAKALRVQLSSMDEVQYAAAIPLPSTLHKNNSFSPPPPHSTPSKLLDRSPDWSPISTARFSIAPSIESASTHGDNATATPPRKSQTVSALLLTPSKSERGTPSAEAAKKSQALIQDKPKDGTKTKQPTKIRNKAIAVSVKAPVKSAQVIKKPNVKYIKPSGQAKKAKAKGNKQAMVTNNPLTNTFKPSKTTSATAKGGKNDPLSPMNSPSKLRQVINAFPHPEPMVPLSPSDPRNNTSPTTTDHGKDASMQSGLRHWENSMQEPKRNSMNVLNMIN